MLMSSLLLLATQWLCLARVGPAHFVDQACTAEPVPAFAFEADAVLDIVLECVGRICIGRRWLQLRLLELLHAVHSIDANGGEFITLVILPHYDERTVCTHQCLVRTRVTHEKILRAKHRHQQTTV